MTEVIMAASPRVVEVPSFAGAPLEVRFMSVQEFREIESSCRAHMDDLWILFNTRGKCLAIQAQTTWVALVLDEDERYLGSVFVVESRPFWIVHYVMTLPEYQSGGVGTAAMWRVMQEARNRGVACVLLNCNPAKGLPEFYARFGFEVVSSTAKEETAA